MYRVQVAGRKRLFVEMLVSVISSAPDWSAVAVEMGDGEPVPIADDETVDVLLVHTDPDEAPAGWVARWRETQPDVPLVLLCTQHGAAAHRIATKLATAGVLDPQIDPDGLVAALQEAVEKGQVSNPGLGASPSSAARGDQWTLTSRQVEVVQLLAAGHETEHIARSLGITPNTLRTHLQNVMVKLGAHSRVEVVTRARKLGLLSTPVGTVGSG